MEHKFINQIEAGQTVNDIYMVSEPILRSTSRGDLYIAMYLSDKTGRLNGRMWQASEEIYSSLPKPGFVQIQGRSELYQNNLQIVVNKVTPIEAEKVSLEDFLARTNKDTAKMFEEIKSILATIKQPQLRAIVGQFLSDKELMEKFCKAPAAAKLHHNYLGGLLEHTHSIMKMASLLLPLYPKVQKDLVLAGAFLHDIGKTEELTYEMSFSYTDSGQLIGHISKGLLMLHKKVAELKAKGTEIGETAIDSLGHIILAHHGQYEFGSPKLPAMAEAFMVYYLDDLDAKLTQVANSIENELGDSNWTAWKNALQTRLYRKQIQ